MRILYFGEPGSFSHQAARRRFPTARLQPRPTVEQCFGELLAGRATHIVVPVENASAGMITSTVDQLIALAHSKKRGLVIREALTMKVELVLLASGRGVPIQKMYSHLAPFNHARAWLRKHYPYAEQIIVGSTSEAARLIQGQKGCAAIGGAQAAAEYGLRIVRRGVGGEVPNQTTFLVVGKPVRGAKAASRTSLILETAHRPGALLAVLKALADEKINLTKIESRPIPGKFSEYRFLIEFESSPQTAAYRNAMKKLQSVTRMLAVIGNYPVIRV